VIDRTGSSCADNFLAMSDECILFCDFLSNRDRSHWLDRNNKRITRITELTDKLKQQQQQRQYNDDFIED